MIAGDTLVQSRILAAQLNYRQVTRLRHRPSARREARIHLQYHHRLTYLLSHLLRQRQLSLENKLSSIEDRGQTDRVIIRANPNHNLELEL